MIKPLASPPTHAHKPRGPKSCISTVAAHTQVVCVRRAGMRGSVRLLLLCLVLVALVEAKNLTQAEQDKKDQQTQSVITMAWGIFGFLSFTTAINVTGMLYERKTGSNKVADGGES